MTIKTTRYTLDDLKMVKNLCGIVKTRNELRILKSTIATIETEERNGVTISLQRIKALQTTKEMCNTLWDQSVTDMGDLR